MAVVTFEAVSDVRGFAVITLVLVVAVAFRTVDVAPVVVDVVAGFGRADAAAAGAVAGLVESVLKNNKHKS